VIDNFAWFSQSVLIKQGASFLILPGKPFNLFIIKAIRPILFFFSNREKFQKIYFSVDFLSFLYYIKILNGAGKSIFRCCPRRKRLFAWRSRERVGKR
jgi:hypothetical protein